MEMKKSYLVVYETAANDYLSDMTHKGVSDKTIKLYRNVTNYFKESKTENGTWETEPSVSDVRKWRDSLLDGGTSAKSVCTYLGILRGFFAYAADPDLPAEERYFSCNPVLKKVYPIVKEDHKPYDKVLTSEDIKALWANKRVAYAGKLWERNYAIVTLLLDGKIRNAELLDLRLSDIHFATEENPYNYLIVRKGKGNKFREVDLTDISVSAIKLYLKSGVRPENVSDEDYLFGTSSEHKFGGTSRNHSEWHRGSTNWLSQLVEKHIKDVTGKTGFRSHSLRHNGAIMELNSGTSLEEIQSELGHSSVSTTQIYAGHLQSRRNRMNMQEVYAVRDEWARKNMKMLEGA